MELLEIIFTLFSILIGVAIYSKGFLKKALDWMNKRYLHFCQSSLDQSDDQLIKTLKPVVFGFSIFLMALASLLLQWWGENDKDVQQLSFAWFATTAFCGLVLIPSQEFVRRAQKIINLLISTAKWSSVALAGIIAFVLFIFTALGKVITQQELQEVITLNSTYLAVVLIFAAVILYASIIGLPYILQKIFLLLVRKTIEFTLKKERNNPISIPILFISIVITLITFISYMIGKIA